MNKTNDFKYNLPAYSDPVDIEDLNDNFRGIDDALMAGLCKKDYTGNNMGSSDPSARKYAWAPWLEIVNDNEFDVVVTDRNAPVGSEEATINIAAGQTFRKYINGRYYMNFYVQDQHDVTFKWFTNAETYINESGGGGGGTGTVTSVSVQGGSGSHLTGSGNPIETSGTITINVDEGYSIPSENEQTAWDGKAADLKAEINPSTYVMTLQLKDSAGNLIGSEKTIDLPLETMVVDGEYDPQTKKIKLELKNGNYVEFSVADLVSGLQTELSASNKLDPDYIDYDSSHRAVSDTEKTTWNGKQNALTFDDTPTQNSNNPVKSGGIYSALAGKQASLDSTQLAAVNSSIDSAKVAQISTNQTNILYSINNGVKNICDYVNPLQLNNCEIVDGEFKQTVTDSKANLNFMVSAVRSDGTTYALFTSATITANGEYSYEFNFPADVVAISIGHNGTTRDAKFHINVDHFVVGITYVISINVLNCVQSSGVYRFNKIMICTKQLWDTIGHDFMPPALPNYDLTYLQAQDRAALVEEIDAGAKNLIDTPTVTVAGITFTADSGHYITASPNNSDPREYTYANCQWKTHLKKGNYVLAIDIKTATSGNSAVVALLNSSSTIVATINNNQLVNKTGIVYSEFTVTTEGDYGVIMKCYAMVARLMVCTKASFGVSKAFVPYRPNYDLVCNEVTALMNNMGGLTFNGSDLNTLVTGGRYLVNNASDNPVSNAPYNSWQTVEVFQSDYSTYPKVYYQIATDVTGATVTSKWRRRTYSSGGQYNAWTSWSS